MLTAWGGKCLWIWAKISVSSDFETKMTKNGLVTRTAQEFYGFGGPSTLRVFNTDEFYSKTTKLEPIYALFNGVSYNCNNYVTWGARCDCNQDIITFLQYKYSAMMGIWMVCLKI